MILKKITIENIASIESAVIDFSQSPLKEADIFLIHGETGAGKTTIIDAICLALFDNTPRLKSAPNAKLSFDSYTLTSRDTANMLRHGAMDGRAELEFVGNDNEEYTAIWTAHSTRTRTNINTAHFLLHNGTQVAQGSQVNQMMQGGIIGMTFDDFCRTAVLAQGEFTRFLKSDDNEKSAILEKLTATEQFSEMGRAIYKVWKEKEEAFKDLQKQVEGIELLSQEAIQAISDIVAEATAKVSSVDSEVAKLTAQRNWLSEEERLQKSIIESENKLNEAKGQTAEPTYLTETKLLEDFQVSQQALSHLGDLHLNESRRHQAEEAEKKLATLFGRATAGLAYQHQQLAQQKKELGNIESVLTRHQPHRDMLEKADAILTHLKHAHKMMEAANIERTKAKELEAKISSMEKAVQDALSAQEEALKLVDGKTQDINAQQKKIDELNAKGITERNVELQKRSQQMNDAALALQNLLDSIEKVKETEQKIAKLQEEIEKCLPDMTNLREEKEMAVAAFNQADNSFRSISLASESWAKEARAILKDGDKCPVCGNYYHAAHFDEVVTRVKDKEAQKLDEARKRKEKAESEYNMLSASLAQKGKEKDVLQTKELEQRLTHRHDVFCKAQTTCFQAGISLEDESQEACFQAVAAGKGLRNALHEQIEDNAKSMTNLKNLNDGLSALNKQLSKLKDAQSKANTNVAHAQNELRNCQLGIKTALDNAQEYARQAKESVATANNLITWPNWQAEWTQDSTVFEERLNAVATEYSEAKNQSARVKPLVSQLETQLQVFDGQCNALALANPSWVVMQADGQYADDLAQQWNRLTTEAAAVKQQMSTSKAAIEENFNWLEQFYKEHPTIDQSRLELLKSFNAEEVKQKHEKHEGLVKQLEGAASAIRQSFESHSLTKPSGLDPLKDIAAITKEISDLNQRRDELSQTIGAENQKLQINKTRQETYGEKMTELEAKKKVLDRWTLFNQNYGDVNGTKFRRLAQQLIFDRLLQLANQHLSRLTARYSLQTIMGTLSIRLCDQYTPGFSSSVHNLSGGESFMVSLSLALALSGMGRDGISMDTLFIDEGFGTLSTENQVRVMDLLQTLQRTQGKRVGVISHVPYLLERIPVQIQVSRHPEDYTKSSIRILTATT